MFYLLPFLKGFYFKISLPLIECLNHVSFSSKIYILLHVWFDCKSFTAIRQYTSYNMCTYSKHFQFSYLKIINLFSHCIHLNAIWHIVWGVQCIRCIVYCITLVFGHNRLCIIHNDYEYQLWGITQILNCHISFACVLSLTSRRHRYNTEILFPVLCFNIMPLHGWGGGVGDESELCC